jgi:hypothetical protein
MKLKTAKTFSVFLCNSSQKKAGCCWNNNWPVCPHGCAFVTIEIRRAWRLITAAPDYAALIPASINLAKLAAWPEQEILNRLRKIGGCFRSRALGLDWLGPAPFSDFY